MPPEIRLLTSADEGLLSRASSAAFDDPIDGRAMREFLADSRHHIAAAVEDGVVVGFATAVHYVHPDKRDPELWINEVNVAPSHRGRGLGKAVVRALLGVARTLGCAEAWVLTERSNGTAMRLYASEGGVEAPIDQTMFTFRLGDSSAGNVTRHPHEETMAVQPVDIDRYLSSLLAPHDDALDAALSSSTAAGLPEIQVSPTHGKLLHLLARLQNARAILEIGTLGGYSAIWLARALAPGGKLITLEFDPKHAEVARANIARAGLADRVEIRVGAALEALSKLEAEKAGPFDLVFIDADKVNNPHYFEWALKLTKRGSLIIIDNVVREGSVLDAKSADPSVQGTRRALEMIAAEPRVTATAIQTIGLKGHDGFAIALVTG